MTDVKKKAVVVTTKHRGVFFGYVEDDSKAQAEIDLSDARMCVYWSADVKGVLGLAATGPTKECRITHSVPKMKVYEVTSVIECSSESAKKWEQSIWK